MGLGVLVWMLPFGGQGLMMAVDEFHFHRARGLPRWEWIGHAVDASGLLACLAVPLLLNTSRAHLALYGLLGLASSLLVTKDEFMHQKLCGGWEHWCHAMLFLLHPGVLMAAGFLWFCVHEPAACHFLGACLGLPVPAPGIAAWMLRVQGLGVLGFLVFQVAYWGMR